MSQPLAPDAGMALIAGAYGNTDTDRPPPPNELPDDGDGGGPGLAAELEIFARLAVSLDGAAAEMRRNRDARRIPWDYCHPVPLNPLVLNAAGTDSDERWEPRGRWVWHITRISAQSNAAGGGTSVVLHQDSANAAGAYALQALPFPGTVVAAGNFLGCWEPKGKFLMPGSRIIAQAIGGGVTLNGEAIEIDIAWLPTYLM